MGREGVDWIHGSQDGDQWWVLVNTVNEPLASIKGGEFLDWFSAYKLLNDSAPCS